MFVNRKYIFLDVSYTVHSICFPCANHRKSSSNVSVCKYFRLRWMYKV